MVVEVQLGRIPANSETAPAGMYCGATDDAKRVHEVLSLEGGLTSLGLASQETVTQVSPEPRC